MSRVEKGLKTMIEEDTVPEADYEVEITDVKPASDKGWESAKLKITQAEDDELIGRYGSMTLINVNDGRSIGLRQLLLHKHWSEVPEDENGDRDTRNLIGVRFLARATHKDGRTNFNPIITPEDYEWQNRLLAGEDVEEGEAHEVVERREDAAKRGGKKAAPPKKKVGRR